MFYLPSGVHSFIAPGKLFRKHPHPCWSCIRCPAKSGNPGSPALRDLTITSQPQGRCREMDPQTDVAGPVRTEQMRKVATACLGGTERSGHPARPPRRRRTRPGAHPGAHPAAGPRLQVMLGRQPLSISGKSSNQGQKAALGSGQFLKTTQEFPQKATHHLVGTRNTFAEHRAGGRCRPEKEARVYLVRCGGSVSLTSLHRQLFCRGRNQKRAGSSRC